MTTTLPNGPGSTLVVLGFAAAALFRGSSA